MSNVDVYKADIQVSNFKFIVGTQFNVAWDSTLLVLDSVGNFGLPLKLDDHFGLVSKSKLLVALNVAPTISNEALSVSPRPATIV